MADGRRGREWAGYGGWEMRPKGEVLRAHGQSGRHGREVTIPGFVWVGDGLTA